MAKVHTAEGSRLMRSYRQEAEPRRVSVITFSSRSPPSSTHVMP